MTKLYDAVVRFAKKNPNHPDNHPELGWDQQCALLMSRIGNASTAKGGLGWRVSPRAYGDAIEVARDSGTLNKDSKKAPIGAYHFWDIGRYGHVGIDASGKGTHIFMATSHLEHVVEPHLGFSSEAAYTNYAKTQGGKYLGWSTNYRGGKLNLPAEATPVVKPASPTATQRKTVAAGANVRELPKVASKVTGFAKPNTIHNVVGYIHGEKLTEGAVTSDIWFKLASGYSWAGGYTSTAVGTLRDLTPKPPVVKPPVIVPPVVPTEPEQETTQPTKPLPAWVINSLKALGDFFKSTS